MKTKQGYLPCSGCGLWASEWREHDGTNRPVRSPPGVSVEKGEAWTCEWCVREGHEQAATMETTTKRTLL